MNQLKESGQEDILGRWFCQGKSEHCQVNCMVYIQILYLAKFQMGIFYNVFHHHSVDGHLKCNQGMTLNLLKE